ncbi:MAG TPA: hypothetical protein VEL74_23720 [Thermoanaerobaculia bacterium]|nr:hypothetical protein [Thermoanaerobaculia bacterium]
MDFDTRKKYYNLCKPTEPLAPGDPRNLPIDELDGAVRGWHWVDRFAKKIGMVEEPVLELFTGLPGSGKSTELRRLSARLSDKKGAHLLPVLIDAEEVIDLTNPIDVPDILAAILHETEKCVLIHEGRNSDQALQEGYLTRFWHWLTTTDVAIGQAGFSVPGGGPNLVAEMKTRPSLRKRVRETVAAHLSGFLGEVEDEMSLLDRRARDLGYRGLVVIFDSLEKLRGISTNWKDVLDSAEEIFAANAPHLRLPVHVIYTVPAALVARARIANVEFMPMIKLQTREGEPFEPGMEAARELIRRRIPDDVLGELFGPDAEVRLAKLIRWSGGYPREIVRLLREVLLLSEEPVPDEDVERILGEVRSSYRMMVSSDAFEWLARVSVERFLTLENDDHRQVADRMLQNNAVLRYLNQESWFDLHPALYEIPGLQKVIARMKSGG